MKIFSTLKMGEFHTNFCEDFLFYEQLNSRWLVAAVMDGCSSGETSHFASTLFGKLLKKICKTLPYLELENPSLSLEKIEIQPLSEIILEKFFGEVKTSQNNLFLEVQELVSTCILMVYDASNKTTWINISGDGVIVINDEVIVVEQDNKPNYLAYHLKLKFRDWFSEQTNTYLFENVENIGISSDGILSFAKNNKEMVDGIDPLEYLLLDSELSEQANMLDKKCILLEKKYGLKPNDDLGIVRIID